MAYTTGKSLRAPDTVRKATLVNRAPRRKFSVSLSNHTSEMFEELKQLTHADTDSEVFRNALRLHLTIVRAVNDGNIIMLRDKDNIMHPLNFIVSDKAK